MESEFDLKAYVERIAVEVVRREIEAQRPARVDASGVVSVPTAAKLTDYKPATIRKWIRQGRVTNYGRHGSPRVKVAEILRMEG